MGVLEMRHARLICSAPCPQGVGRGAEFPAGVNLKDVQALAAQTRAVPTVTVPLDSVC